MGVLEAIRVCQKKFVNAKWNCTTFNGDHLFGRFVENCKCDTSQILDFLLFCFFLVRYKRVSHCESFFVCGGVL